MIGKRPIDFHIQALEQVGAVIENRGMKNEGAGNGSRPSPRLFAGAVGVSSFEREVLVFLWRKEPRLRLLLGGRLNDFSKWGHLRLDLAFSRYPEHKIYVQQKFGG